MITPFREQLSAIINEEGCGGLTDLIDGNLTAVFVAVADRLRPHVNPLPRRLPSLPEGAYDLRNSSSTALV